VVKNWNMGQCYSSSSSTQGGHSSGDHDSFKLEEKIYGCLWLENKGLGST